IMGEQGTHEQEFVPLIGGGGCSHDRVHKVMKTIIGQESTTQLVFFDRKLVVVLAVDPVERGFNVWDFLTKNVFFEVVAVGVVFFGGNQARVGFLDSVTKTHHTALDLG